MSIDTFLYEDQGAYKDPLVSLSIVDEAHYQRSDAVAIAQSKRIQSHVFSPLVCEKLEGISDLASW